jgi:hypothetical protein
MVSNRTQHPRSLPATHCLYLLYFTTEKGDKQGKGRIKVKKEEEGELKRDYRDENQGCSGKLWDEGGREGSMKKAKEEEEGELKEGLAG